MRTDLGKARLLFWTFFKIGAFTFGGGYAMIPLIQREVAERRRWLKDGDILDIVAIAESTPGPIAINSATFVGYQVCGTFGAFCATLGVVLPSFLVIYVISFVLRQFSQLPGGAVCLQRHPGRCPGPAAEGAAVHVPAESQGSCGLRDHGWCLCADGLLRRGCRAGDPGQRCIGLAASHMAKRRAAE